MTVRRLAVVIGVGVMVGCGGAGGDPISQLPRLALAEGHSSLHALEFRAVGLAWIDDGTVAVIDRDDQQIVSLSLADGSVRRGAGKGGGPGELEGAVTLVSDAGGRLAVGDMRARRVSLFDERLAFQGSARLPGLPLELLGLSGETVLSMWLGFDGGPRPIVGVVDLAADATRPLFSPYEVAGGVTPPREDNPFNPPFVSATLTADGRVYVGHGQEYRVVAFDTAGAVRGEVAREIPPRYLSDEEKTAEARRLDRRETPPPLRQLRADALDEPRPFFGPNALASDAGGRLWVVTARLRGDSTEVDIFGAGGGFVGTLALRDRVEVLAIRGRRLAALVSRLDPELEGYSGIDTYEMAVR